MSGIAYPMNGGNGTYSNTKNSDYQRAASSIAQTMIDEAVSEKLDIRGLTSTSDALHVADFGCSVGPNTFIFMQNVLNSIAKKCEDQGITLKDLEIQVFFNDHATNDFNALFASVPLDKKYYAAGVPGSFYGRLFPTSSLHFAHSSFALHWLSKLPEELLDKNSPAWNKGRIHYASANEDVVNAYANQFGTDMEMFLDGRAKELVGGGLMVMIMLGRANGARPCEVLSCILTDYFGSKLMEMVNEGYIEEDQVDTFNLPVYIPSVEEMKMLVESNGCFDIERIEIRNPVSETNVVIDARSMIMHRRAATESVFLKHFGREITDKLFDRSLEKLTEISDQFDSSYKKPSQLFVVLQRKNDI